MTSSTTFVPLWPGDTLVSFITNTEERRAYILALSPDRSTLEGLK